MKRTVSVMLLAAVFSLGNKAYAQNERNMPDGVNMSQNDSRNGRMSGKDDFNGGFKPCPCCMKDMKKENSGNNREGHGVPKNNGQNMGYNGQNMGNGGQGFDGQGMNNPPQKRDFPKCKCSKKCKNCDCNKTSSKKSKSSSKKNKNKRNIN